MKEGVLKPLDKTAVRRAFDRLAPGYLEAAQVQSEICQRMLSRLELVRLTPSVILDLGAGPGIAAHAMAARYPSATAIALDISYGMLRQIPRVSKWPRWLGGGVPVRALCADFERLPLATASVDCVVSNLSLAWLEDFARGIAEWHRVLKPGGLLMFTTLGPDTLMEWAPRLNPAFKERLADMHDLGDLLSHRGFSGPVMDQEHLRLTYSHPAKLLADLKSWGGLDVHVDRPRGLAGKQRRAAIAGDAIEVSATLEVIYGHAWKPETLAHPGHQLQDGRSVIRFASKT